MTDQKQVFNQKNSESKRELKIDMKCIDVKTAPFSYGVTEAPQNEVEKLRNEVNLLRLLVVHHENLIATLMHEVSLLRDSNEDSD
jgi:hypothetical protein